jgi:hypothetical protein
MIREGYLDGCIDVMTSLTSKGIKYGEYAWSVEAEREAPPLCLNLGEVINRVHDDFNLINFCNYTHAFLSKCLLYKLIGTSRGFD